MQKDNTKYSSTKFLISLAVSSIIILTLIGITTYAVDPFFKYRIDPKEGHLLNTRFVNPGLAKHYDYNMVLLGSSMVQTFDMSLFKTSPAVKPLRLATGAANYDEMKLIYSLINKEKVNSMVINLDLAAFNLSNPVIKYPTYTYKDDLINEFGYLYSYEACIRYVPVDIGLNIFYKLQTDIPEAIREKTDINTIGDFRNEYNFYNQVSYIRHLYESGSGVTPQVNEGMTDRMIARFEQLLVDFDINNNKHIKYTFILPPYPIAYWGYTDKKKYYQNFQEIVRYMTLRLSEYDNVLLVCFYDIDNVMRLDRYADLSHFDPITSDFIVNNLNTVKYKLTPDNVDIRLQRLDSMVSVFNIEYAEWNE